VEQTIVAEEQKNLDRLLSFAPVVERSKTQEALLEQIAEINEMIPDANDDDLSALKDQLIRLNLLLHQEERVNAEGVNLNNPYFAHLRLKEKNRTRDLYLGHQVYNTPDRQIQIIDWRVSPIAIIYFLYEEGDEYEEEIEGRIFEGEVVLKRMVKIADGRLYQIQQGRTLLVRESENTWCRYQADKQLLKGGAGVSSRPENTVTAEPKLGLNRSGTVRKDKLLPEITALIDADQFELITRPESGIVSIQGTAGSGKTTVALHRVAWLHFQDRHRFAADKMQVMVFNKALANYISKILPSLGVHDVNIDYFENWASALRIRLFQTRLPKKYCDRTPVNVIRFKKHPALLQIINEFIQSKIEAFETALDHILSRRQVTGFPRQELNELPLITRLFTLVEWIDGQNQFQGRRFSFGFETSNLLRRLVLDAIDPEKSRVDCVVQYWEELFSNFEFLKTRLRILAGNDLTENMLAEVIDWQKQQYMQRLSLDTESKPDLFEIMSDEDRVGLDHPTLDYEDDPILLYFYQKLFKDIVKKSGSKLVVNHLMVDEVQDLSPIEIAVLLGILTPPPSLTLAGDVDQKMVEYSGFTNWENMFQQTGLKGQIVSTLKIGYRSTFEIMTFAHQVLGHLASTSEYAATRHGPPVELFQFSSQGELIYFLSKSLKDLTQIEPNASIVLICASPMDAVAYFQLLDRMELADLRLVSDQDFSFSAGIDVTDIKQVKGLEFDYAIILDADRINFPEHPYSRYLLHIAASRAAHQLWLMNYREPSPILPSSLIERMIR